jgi:PAS domain S-box-containing protein
MTSDHNRQPWYRISGRVLTWTLLCIACLCLGPTGTYAADSPDRPKRILVIPSYNFDYKGSQWFLQGVMTEFNEQKSFKVTFLPENLQLAAHASDRQYLDSMAAALKIKYSLEKPDLIIVNYMQALQFMERYGRDIFGSVPVVFAGLSIVGYNPEKLPDNYTGIVAYYSTQKNIELILRNHPRVRKVYVVGGTSPVERSLVNEAIREAAPYREKIELIALTDMAFPALLAKLGSLSDDSVVIYQVMQLDAAGKVFVPAQAAVEIARAASVPVYGMLDTYMGSGITGGFLIHHESLGRKAATIAIQWLESGLMPVRQMQSEPIGSYLFDWRQLKRWGIDEHALPSGSQKEFKTFSVWEAYRAEIIIGAGLIVLQTLLIIGLIWNRYRRIKTEEKLRESEEKYRNLFENANEAIFIAQEGKLVFLNPMTTTMIGYSGEELMAKPFIEFIHPEDRDMVIDRHIRRMKGEEIPTRYPFRIVHSDGDIRWVELSTILINWMGKAATLNFLIDITERKRSEQETAILAEIGRVIGLTLEIEEVYEIFAAEVRKLVPFDRLSVSLNHPHEGTQIVAYVSGHDIPLRRQGDIFPLKGTVNEAILRTKTGLLIPTANIEDVAGRLPGLTTVTQEDMHSVMSVPLISYDEVIGALHFRSKKPNTYGEQDLRFAERIGMQIAGAIANAQMFSDLSHTEKALRESEAKYRQLFDNAPTAIYQIDFRTGKFLKANDVICEYLSCSQEEITSFSPYEIMTDESKQLLSERLEKMGLGEKVTENPEYEVVDKKGKRRWLQLHSKNIYNAEGLVIGADVVAHDITERRQAEEGLRESEERYRQLVEYAPAAIYEADLTTGRLLSVNEVLCEYSGYTRDELLALNPLDLMSEESQKLILQRMASYAAGEPVPPTVEYKARSKTGREFWISTNAKYFYQAGLPVRATVVAHDISERKRVEEEKQDLEERLRRSEKMEALGQLAGGVAHDLNNVLGILTGYSELLLLEIPEGKRPRGYIEKILQSTEKGAAIIQDLLTLARRGVAASDVINLNNIVSGFLKTPVFEKMKDYNPRVTFKTEYVKNLLNIKGSPVHLEKTLMNLVSNAAESIYGKGEVTIRTESRYLDQAIRGYDEVKEGDYAVLIVSDTGMGIPAENREKIFEPFYTKKTMGRSGTGLGLAIVWGTVKDHNGYIDMQTEVGQGTTFTLYFPVTREELIAPQQKVPIERYMGKGESVLVVDDVLEQRKVATGLLTRLGYEVHSVSSGEEAVEYLKGNKADILVLDMIMAPGIDGLETYQRVLEVNPKQKAIIVSGFSETERVKEAQKLGAGAYVRKPYVLEKIGMAIRDELLKTNNT